MPKVSVIVPVYNVEKYLDRCLDSLVNQTLQEIEIIVINDSTPDQSQIIIDKYMNLYPNKVFSYIKPNGGLSDARNYGMSKMKGDYFGFVDGDDYVEYSMFEKLYERATQEEADVTTCDFYWTYPNRLQRATDGPYTNERELLTKMMPTVWNKLYKKSWFDSLDIKFPVGLRYEDSSFSIRLAPFIRKLAYVNEPLVYYVQRQDSITYTQNSKVGDMLTVFNDIFEFYQKHNLYDQYQSELEYLTLKYFLGSSFLRAAQIQDKNTRKAILKEGWDLLNKRFPTWRKNQYLLSQKDKKHLYYQYTNKSIYDALANAIYIMKVQLKK
ncbi:glycosyltransferase family 2 protein [Turicibacter bilis]|uniref:glycosyltransferase family 2 protein n=1 Tax=Turicibacter bilis TaxID=2735723 RepID=UPI0031BB31BF